MSDIANTSGNFFSKEELLLIMEISNKHREVCCVSFVLKTRLQIDSTNSSSFPTPRTCESGCPTSMEIRLGWARPGDSSSGAVDKFPQQYFPGDHGSVCARAVLGEEVLVRECESISREVLLLFIQ